MIRVWLLQPSQTQTGVSRLGLAVVHTLGSTSSHGTQGSLIIDLPHPAYSDPNILGSKSCEESEAGIFINCDPRKACTAFENASRLNDPRLQIHLQTSAATISDKGRNLLDIGEIQKLDR